MTLERLGENSQTSKERWSRLTRLQASRSSSSEIGLKRTCAPPSPKTARHRLGPATIGPTVLTRHTPKNGSPFPPEAILGGFSFRDGNRVRTTGSGADDPMNDRKISDVQVSYDLVADEYARRISDELMHKPLDRQLLDQFAAHVQGLGLVCDLGCGPGHVHYLPSTRRACIRS